MTEEEAFQEALTTVERNDLGDVDEKKLIDEVARLLEFDESAERHAKAARVVKRHRRPGQTEPSGQLALPGIEPYAWEPERLVADNEGHVIEQAKAPVSFKHAEAERARANARRQQDHADRKTREHEGFAAWLIDEATRGRPIKGLGFGDYVHEAELWRDEEAGPEPGAVEDAA